MSFADPTAGLELDMRFKRNTKIHAQRCRRSNAQSPSFWKWTQLCRHNDLVLKEADRCNSCSSFCNLACLKGPEIGREHGTLAQGFCRTPHAISVQNTELARGPKKRSQRAFLLQRRAAPKSVHSVPLRFEVTEYHFPLASRQDDQDDRQDRGELLGRGESETKGLEDDDLYI